MAINDRDEFIIVKAIIVVKTAEQGGRSGPIYNGYRPNHFFDLQESKEIMSAYVGDLQFDDQQPIYPGETKMVTIRFLNVPQIKKHLFIGQKWKINEGNRNVAIAELVEI